LFDFLEFLLFLCMVFVFFLSITLVSSFIIACAWCFESCLPPLNWAITLSHCFEFLLLWMWLLQYQAHPPSLLVHFYYFEFSLLLFFVFSPFHMCKFWSCQTLDINIKLFFRRFFFNLFFSIFVISFIFFCCCVFCVVCLSLFFWCF
jgi:hypothetical protein